MKSLLISLILIFSVGASAATLDVLKQVVTSKEVASVVTELEKSTNTYIRITSVTLVATYRCPGCFAYEIKLQGTPRNGSEIMLVSTLHVSTRGQMDSNKLAISVSIQE